MIASRFCPLPIRMPATIASSVPRTHETLATVLGLAPLRAASVGLSTTARMAVPIRLT